MSRVAVLGDTHFGVRSDSKEFSNYFRKFYSEVFFPYLKENNITEIYQLGDLFDRRKYVNFLTLAECRDYFFDVIEREGMSLHILIGNHDIFWRESLSVNSPDLLLKDYKSVTLYDKPTTTTIGGKPTDIIPWICKDNEEEISDFFLKSSSDLCLGHFEIAGFQMYKGVDSHSGISPESFKKYDLVLSGHYHHRSSNGNIVYVGTPMEHTWADYDDPRGFHILDTDTNGLEFIENPHRVFVKYWYNDETTEDPLSIDFSQFANKHIKLIVVSKKDFYIFDKFLERIYLQNPLELKVVEDMSDLDGSSVSDTDLDVEDTLTLLSQYCDNIVVDVDKDKLKTLMRTLYVEAQNVEE